MPLSLLNNTGVRLKATEMFVYVRVSVCVCVCVTLEILTRQTYIHNYIAPIKNLIMVC